MTHHDQDVWQSDWVEPPPGLAGPYYIWNFIKKTLVIVELEARKLRHDPLELAMRAVQPALWLLIFGQVFSNIRAIPTGNVRYIDFMTPGILAQSILFVSIFSGMTIIWERDVGIIHKFLASPTPRGALVLGKALSAGVKCLVQAVIIYILALFLKINLNWNPLDLLVMLLVVFLSATCFSAFSLLIACLLKSRERFMGIGQVMTMPLFFASNAIYPISIMPGWLQFLAKVNPLTYTVDALRSLMIMGGQTSNGIWLDLLVLFGVATVLIWICARVYPNVII